MCPQHVEIVCIFDMVNKFASWTCWRSNISLTNSTSVHPQHVDIVCIIEIFTKFASPRCSLSVYSWELFLHFFQLTDTNNFLHDLYTFSFWDPCFYSYYFWILLLSCAYYNYFQTYSSLKIQFVELWILLSRITNYPKIPFCIFWKHINIKYRFLCVFMKLSMK